MFVPHKLWWVQNKTLVWAQGVRLSPRKLLSFKDFIGFKGEGNPKTKICILIN
jgi:hypothetical protein